MITDSFPRFNPTAALQNAMISHQHPDAISPFSVPSSSSSPYTVDVSDIHCRVCERKYDGSQHFGIDICRACAAFFRRSVSVKKTFVCRRGTNLCPLNTISRKTTCQKCRWMRCLSVGLNVDLVNGRRSPDPVKSAPSNHVAVPTKQEEEESDTGSEGRSAEDIDESPSPSITFPPVPVLRPIPHSGTLNLDTTPPTLVNRVLLNYREFTKQRLEVEKSLPHMNGDSKIFGSTGVPLFKATREMFFRIYQKQLELLHDFLRSTFDEYAVCNIEEQRRMCCLFYPVLWELESCYWTYRNMPVGADYEHLLMCTQTTYIDSKDVRFWIGNAEGQDEASVRVMEEQLEILLHEARGTVLKPMRKSIIKEFEFVVLLALNIWATKNHREFPESDARATQVRTTLFNDIHILYHDGLKIDNYAAQIGDLLELCTAVQNASTFSIVKNILFADLIAYIDSS